MSSSNNEKSLPAKRGWLIFGITLILLVTLRWPILTMPLYEDQSVGFGREAEYLLNHRFDYQKLRREEPHFMFGGTYRSYVVSAIPTLLASLVRTTGTPARGILLWHILSFICAAGIMGLLASIWASRLSLSATLITVAALVSTPMFIVQADVAGMELPLTLFSLSAGWALSRGKPIEAVLLASVAFFMKASGLLVLAAVAVVCVGHYVFIQRDRRYAWGALLACGIGAGLVALLAWGDDTALFRATFHWPSAFRLPRAFLWCPDFFLILAGVLATCMIAIWENRSILIDPLSRQQFLLTDNRGMILLWAGLIVGGLIGSMASYIFIPRYYVLPLVLIYLVAGVVLSLGGRSAMWLRGALTAVFLVNIVNHAGWLYPAINRVAGPDLDVLAVFTTRNCGFTERSLEYLDDQHSSMEAVSRLSTIPRDATIFAEMPHWVYLATPFVGYVSAKPADLIRADRFSTVVRSFRDRLMQTPPSHDIYFLASEKATTRMPRPGKEVEVIYRDSLRPPLMILKVRRDLLPTSPREIEDWFLDATWDKEHALHRSIDRYDFLRQTGRLTRAARELHFARWLFPNPADPEIRRAVYTLAVDLQTAFSQAIEKEHFAWTLNTAADAESSLSIDRQNDRLFISNRSVPGQDLSAITLKGPRHFLREGQQYAIRCRLRATRPCDVRIRLIDPFEPSHSLGIEHSVQATESWQEIVIPVQITRTEPDATLAYDLGRAFVVFEIDSVSFEPVAPMKPEP
ncbi:hypothetical protein K2X85_19995 [bacterium]|nr:hypothetical protein [bacterium]